MGGLPPPEGSLFESPPLETSYLLTPPLKRILAVTNHKKVGKFPLKSYLLFNNI